MSRCLENVIHGLYAVNLLCSLFDMKKCLYSDKSSSDNRYLACKLDAVAKYVNCGCNIGSVDTRYALWYKRTGTACTNYCIPVACYNLFCRSFLIHNNLDSRFIKAINHVLDKGHHVPLE